MGHFLYNLRNRFIKPYNTGYLPEQDGHKIFFQEIGNPEGQPVIYFHGGPGGSGKPHHAATYNLKKYRVILFDQRGGGLSEYKDQVKHNTIQKTVEDANRLLDYLNVKTKVIAAGCSWGATCALVFAETYPKRVKKIIVNAIFLGRAKDVAKLSPVIDLFYPDMWADVQKVAGKEDPDTYFTRLIFSPKKADQQKAMKYYKTLEHTTTGGDLSYAFPNQEYSDKEIAKFRIFMHFQINHFFLKENQIIKDAGKIKNIPTEIYQDRWDPCCPPYEAYDLHRALPKSKLHMIAASGHVHPDMFWQMYQDNLKDYK